MLQTKPYQRFKRISSAVALLCFGLNCIAPAPLYAQTSLTLPPPGIRIGLSPEFAPALLKGVKVDLDNPFQLEFIVEEGDTALEAEAFKAEAARLIKYFLASMTVPEDDLWVNLSPYESNRIVPEKFGQTEMGRDLLAQDYLLKQLVSSLIYPEEELGKRFWDTVYKEAFEKYGTTQIPVSTFNKVWIVPEKAVVYENGPTAYVVESKLTVMLEEDFLAMEKNQADEYGIVPEEVNEVSAKVLREIIIPKLNDEVNRGKNFAELRQIYHSLILAAWYKKKIKDSILNKIYSNQNKTTGIDLEDKNVKQKIYEQYVEAFKTGVYNYIKEDYDPALQMMIPRKYFSGGVRLDMGKASRAVTSMELDRPEVMTITNNIQILPERPRNRLVNVALRNPVNPQRELPLEGLGKPVPENAALDADDIFGTESIADRADRVVAAVREQFITYDTVGHMTSLLNPEEVGPAYREWLAEVEELPRRPEDLIAVSEEVSLEVARFLNQNRDALRVRSFGRDVIQNALRHEDGFDKSYSYLNALDQMQLVREVSLEGEFNGVVDRLSSIFGSHHMRTEDVRRRTFVTFIPPETTPRIQAALEIGRILMDHYHRPSAYTLSGARAMIEEGVEGYQFVTDPQNITEESLLKDFNALVEGDYHRLARALALRNIRQHNTTSSAFRAGNQHFVLIERDLSPQEQHRHIMEEAIHTYFEILDENNPLGYQDNAFHETMDTLSVRLLDPQAFQNDPRADIGRKLYEKITQMSIEEIHGERARYLPGQTFPENKMQNIREERRLAHEILADILGDGMQAERLLNQDPAYIEHAMGVYMSDRILRMVTTPERAMAVIATMMEDPSRDWMYDYHLFAERFVDTVSDLDLNRVVTDKQGRIERLMNDSRSGAIRTQAIRQKQRRDDIRSAGKASMSSKEEVAHFLGLTTAETSFVDREAQAKVVRLDHDQVVFRADNNLASLVGLKADYEGNRIFEGTFSHAAVRSQAGTPAERIRASQEALRKNPNLSRALYNSQSGIVRGATGDPFISVTTSPAVPETYGGVHETFVGIYKIPAGQMVADQSQYVDGELHVPHHMPIEWLAAIVTDSDDMDDLTVEKLAERGIQVYKGQVTAERLMDVMRYSDIPTDSLTAAQMPSAVNEMTPVNVRVSLPMEVGMPAQSLNMRVLASPGRTLGAAMQGHLFAHQTLSTLLESGDYELVNARNEPVSFDQPLPIEANQDYELRLKDSSARPAVESERALVDAGRATMVTPGQVAELDSFLNQVDRVGFNFLYLKGETEARRDGSVIPNVLHYTDYGSQYLIFDHAGAAIKVWNGQPAYIKEEVNNAYTLAERGFAPRVWKAGFIGPQSHPRLFIAVDYIQGKSFFDAERFTPAEQKAVRDLMADLLAQKIFVKNLKRNTVRVFNDIQGQTRALMVDTSDVRFMDKFSEGEVAQQYADLLESRVRAGDWDTRGIEGELVDFFRSRALYNDSAYTRPYADAGRASMERPDNVGGITLQGDQLNLEVHNEGRLDFNLDPAALENMQIEGLTPVIMNVTPAMNIRIFLGVNDEDAENELSRL